MDLVVESIGEGDGACAGLTAPLGEPRCLEYSQRRRVARVHGDLDLTHLLDGPAMGNCRTNEPPGDTLSASFGDGVKVPDLGDVESHPRVAEYTGRAKN